MSVPPGSGGSNSGGGETGEVAPRQQRYGRHPVLAPQLHTLTYSGASSCGPWPMPGMTTSVTALSTHFQMSFSPVAPRAESSSRCPKNRSVGACTWREIALILVAKAFRLAIEWRARPIGPEKVCPSPRARFERVGLKAHRVNLIRILRSLRPVLPLRSGPGFFPTRRGSLGRVYGR